MDDRRLRAIRLVHAVVWAAFTGCAAARCTEDRRANFDIYLPEWLVGYKKEIVGPWHLAGVVLLVVRWVGAAN